MSGIEEFSELAETGFAPMTEPTDPKDEFFKSIYISGKTRDNQSGITEKAGKIQVRGKEYNLDEANMVITNVKRILVKFVKNSRGYETVECFSFLDGTPSITGRTCGQTKTERDENPYCKDCKSHIIVAGLYCEPNGKPIMDDGSPVFCFIRAKGMKYMNVSNYLSDLSMKDLPPIFEPSTEETIQKEKTFVHNKRFVTNIKIGEADSQNYGTFKVFELSAGIELPKDKVMDILKLAKKVQPKFVDKFDWSKKKLAEKAKKPDGVLTFDDKPKNQTSEEKKPEPANVDKDFSFDSIEF